ncbi:MAG: Gfo/Idh/MocA family oxidoreductase [Prevotellaceae bacterium]|jgi:predicted dehydrogenase|nr:Gfo/Idh/MocA family oxidoreductase [Prevotellaceae bacterium]
MKKKQINWGFIGCGDVTVSKSGPAFRMVEGSNVVAVMSRHADRAEAYARERDIARWYDDAQALIADDEVNAIYVATPPSSHTTYAIMAMKAGKPVYIEKPMAVSYEECCRINRIADETGTKCFVAYYRRYQPYFLKVKELLEAERIGKVAAVQVRYARPPLPQDLDRAVLPWRLQPDIAGGGYFYDLAPHQIDILQELLGYILEAEGCTANRAGLYDVEDTVTAAFRFDSGVVGSGTWSFAAHETAAEDRIEIIGDHGKISFSTFSYEPISLHTVAVHETFDVGRPNPVQLPLIRAVVEDLQGGARCSCDGVSATTVNWVLDKIMGKS